MIQLIGPSIVRVQVQVGTQVLLKKPSLALNGDFSHALPLAIAESSRRRTDRLLNGIRRNWRAVRAGTRFAGSIGDNDCKYRAKASAFRADNPNWANQFRREARRPRRLIRIAGMGYASRVQIW
jgi:hypothetical protein